ncbi:MAG: DNA mismatch repair protein MutS [Deltaproteobacteria bacterium]|jgi:DNA mismatch repair protein MutS|nr:DNA mismatch repair protein MutS [Deltaproteobacteria bacterium]
MSPTPLMKQYLKEKERYPDAILLFRVGDFYEMFYEDAVTASEVLGIALTSRDKNKTNPIPLCGVPYHAVKNYLSRLLNEGFKVAVCEQVENPREAKGIVKRAVTRVVTPGLILDEDQLEAKTSNYIAAIYSSNPPADYGLAVSDISTGEFKVAHLSSFDEASSELARIKARQIISIDSVRRQFTDSFLFNDILWESADEKLLNLQRAEEYLEKSARIVPEEVKSSPSLTIATAVLIAELQGARPAEPLPPVRIIPYIPSEFMILDESTISNLELFETIRDGSRQGALISVMDQSVTSMGGRKLKSWLLYPLLDIKKIKKRQSAVSVLIKAADYRGQLRNVLRKLPDLERLASRVDHRVASPRDLGVILAGIRILPEIDKLLEAISEVKTNQLITPNKDQLEDIREILEKTLVDEPPVYLKDGGVIRKGFNPELDKLIDLSRGGKNKILEIEKREKKRTGISTLKIKFNKVFGYYIEVPRTKSDEVPDDYIRKQTLKSSERFVTTELAEYESKILEADEKRIILEEELFLDLREKIASEVDRIKYKATSLATIDVLSSLAEIAHKKNYVRPEINNSDVINLKKARHPVIETLMGQGEFVPNDIELSNSSHQIAIITGPNMSGKSTIIRQTALAVLLAQTGSFVPAQKAEIGICDRIFSRVGASDNIARGESTFMVEMKETANILQHSTSRSLVILDEIGRGTSTYDGVSIAWAVVEELHDAIGARTLFATHYHELTALSDIKPRIFNAGVSVKEWKDTILFMRKLVIGAVNRSYGIQVASLAGVSERVINRAKAILDSLQQGKSLTIPFGGEHVANDQNQMALFQAGSESGKPPDAETEKLIDFISDIDPDSITPKQALDLIYTIKEHQKQIKD